MGRRLEHLSHSSRRRWLAASSIAMATAMLSAQAAHAQVTPIARAGQGTVTVQSGTVTTAGTVDGVRSVTQEPRTGGLRDTITIASNEVVLLWNPVDTNTGGGDILFLGRNDAIRFQRDGATYTVINRVIPTDQTRAIRFEGLVESYVNTGVYGGNVFFYSPGGIVVGGTGRFDVGSLGLSSLDVTQTVSTTTTLNFASATQAGSKVRVDPWTTGAFDNSAQIDTFGGGNAYVALVAPTVEQMGRVNSAGNIAYVAAESATMTIVGSLFDIVVSTGTTSGTGVVHGADAETTGSAYGGPDRRIQMVAVPKNEALTMLVSGSVGYQAASSAGIVNGSIVLTAGAPGGGAADLEIENAFFSQPVTARATNDIRISADGPGASVFIDDGQNALDFAVTAGGDIVVNLTDGGGLQVSGNASFVAGSGDTGGNITINADANHTALLKSVNGVSVGGNLTLTSAASGAQNASPGGIGSDAVAGDIAITLTNGALLSVGGNLTANSSARAGFGDGQSGDATAGSFTLNASGELGNVSVGGLTDIDARALPAFSMVDGGPSEGEIGGDATGGDVRLVLNGVNSQFGGAIGIDASAEASGGRNFAIAQDNAAFAGRVTLNYLGGTHSVTGALTIGASAIGGASSPGDGNSVGGSVERAFVDIGIDGAALTIGSVGIDASTDGNSSGSTAGDAIVFAAINGATFSTSSFSATTLHDNRASFNPGIAGGIGLSAEDSSIAVGSLALTTTSTGNSDRPSDKRAGAISISATNGSTITAGSATLTATAVEGDAAPIGRAIHTGGIVSLLADGSTVEVDGGLLIDTSVQVPHGGDMSGAVSTGGDVTLRQLNAGAGMSFGNLSVQAGASPSFSETSFGGDGGSAAGGDVTLDIRAGAFTTSFLSINSSAQGHAGGAQIAAPGDLAGSGGSATGGDITLIANGDSFAPGFLSLNVFASGGDGGTGEVSLGASGGGAGGAAYGGTVDIQALSGTVDISNFVLQVELASLSPSPTPFGAFIVDATARGGSGGFGRGVDGGAGGDATGGTANFTVEGATVTFTTPSLALSASAYGGYGGSTGYDFGTETAGGVGGAGGHGTGGTASYAISRGATNLTSILASSFAGGGRGGENFGAVESSSGPGGAGGSGTGGTASITLGVDDASGLNLVIEATATGGSGGYGTDGTAGGNGQGGIAQLNVANADVTLNSLRIDASAEGGYAGSSSGTGAPGGDGGNGTGGTAGIDVFGLAGALAVSNGIEISSTGQGAAGQAGSYLGDGGAGGSGRGGSIVIVSRDGANLDLLTSSVVDAGGRGGYGGSAGGYDGNPPGIGGSGGAGIGGNIFVEVREATLTASAIEGQVQFSAAGTGGLGGDSAGYYSSIGEPGASGVSIGGSTSLGISGGLFQIDGDLFANANAIGVTDTRARSTGAAATAGAVTVDVSSGGAFSVTGTATLEATALAAIGTDALGDASGGTVTLTMSGPTSTLDIGSALNIDVSAFEQRTGAFAFATATGGDVTGGTATLDFADGTATIVGDVFINAIAGFGNFESTGWGGTATAGDVSLLNDGAATLSLGNVMINAHARGSYGAYYGEGGGGGPGGAGGDAFGGNVLVSNQGTGSLNATSISLDSGATGGRGGDGVGGDGGAAGNGMAGSASVLNGSDLAVQDLTIVANGSGGTGGRGSTGFASSVGGLGMGGEVTLSTSTTLPPLNTLTLEAVGSGGSGSTSSGDFTDGGDGSQGGDGIGGSALLELTGAGTVLPDVAELSIGAGGYGGTGGYGGYGYTNGGDGGAGGAGTGGTLTFAARSGASIDLTGFVSTLRAPGFGGYGGGGGTGGYGDGVAGAGGGTGGAGGFGTGGTLNLIGQGGTITSNEIELTATGRGGAGGSGGYSTPGGENYGSYAPDGLGGGGAGGLVTLQALEGSPGVITLGAVTIDASGFAGGGDFTAPTTGGSIVITDASTDPAGLITMGSLTATALGAVAPAAASFTMSGDSGPITVTGDTSVDVVGDIVFAFAGTGQLLVGGATTLTAGGDITVTHLGNTTNVTSINSAGNFAATAGGDFLAGDGTIVASGAALSITAQNISYGTLLAGTDLTLNAINGSINGSINGILGLVSGGFIDLDATGSIAVGDAESEAGFTADAGSDVSFNQITNSSNDLAINAGGNVSGVTATNDAPAASPGGGRAIVTAGGDVAITNRLTSVSDSVFVDAGGDVAIAQIGAGGSISVTGVGAVSLGRADALVAGSSAIIRGASVELDRTNVAQDLIVEATSGDIIASANLVAGELLDFDSAGGISFASMEGDVVELDAPGAITGGNVTGGLTVTIGGAVAPSSVTAGSVVAIDGPLAITAGSITVNGPTSFSSSVTLTALDGDLTAGQVTAETDITATAPGNVDISGASSGLATRITGSSIRVGPAVAGTLLRLNATGGSVTGTAFLSAGTLIDIDATQAVSLVDGDATTGLEIDAGTSVDFRRLTTSGGDLRVAAGTSLTGTSAINNAPLGSVGLNRVFLSAGGDLTLTDTARSTDDGVFLSATGDLSAGTIDAGQNAQAIADGAVVVGTFNSALDGVLQGASVTVDDGTIGGNLSITATASDISGIGAIDVGQAIDLRASGNIGFGSITATTGFNADAGGSILFGNASTADNNLTFIAGGDISGNSARNLAAAGGSGDDSVNLTAGGVVMLATGRAENSFTVRGASASLTEVSAATGGVGSLDIRIGGLAAVGNASTAGGASALIEGAEVALDNGSFGGNLRLNATAGDISGIGTIAIGGAADFDATGTVGFGSITAGTGFTANAGGNIVFVDAATADNNLVFVAGGSIVGTSASNLAANGSGGDDSVSLTAGGAATLSGASRAENSFIVRAATASIAGVAAATGGVGSLDIRASGLASVGEASTAGSASAFIEGTGVALGSGAIGGNLRLNATGGDVGVAGATVVGGAVDLDATGTIGFASLAAGSGMTANAGTDILFGEATTADGNLALVAGRDILGTRASSLAPAGSGGDDSVSVTAGRDVALAGSSSAENAFTVVAGGAISGGDFAAGGLLTLDGGTIAIGLATADRMVLASDLDIGFAGLASPNAIGLTAANGTIAGGDIDSAGDVTLSARDLTLGNVASGGSLGATATGGDASFAGIEAGGNVTIIAAGTPTLGSLVSGGDTTITGASAALASGTIGGDLSLTATSGAIDATGSLAVGGGIALSAAGDIAFGELSAAGGDFVADAGGAIGFGEASASGALDFTAGAAITGGDLAGGSMTLAAGGDITAQTLGADGSIAGNAGGVLAIGSAVAGDALDLLAGSNLTIADAIGGTVALRSANGAVIVTHDIESTFSGDGQQALVSGSAVQIEDVNGVTLTLAQATDGDIDIVAAGDIGIVNAQSAGDIDLVSTGGDVRVTLVEAGKSFIVPAGSAGEIGLAQIEVGSPGSGDISVSAAGLAQGRFVASGNIGIAVGTTIDLNGADAAGSIALGSGGSTRIFAPASAGADIAIQSGGDVRVTGSQASLQAGDNLTVAAQGVFDTQGFAYGASVSIAAADVIIGSSGQVGDGELTQSIAFTSTGAPVVIGGEGQQGAFALDAQEFGRVRGAGDLSVLAPSGAIEVRALEVLAGSGGSLGTAGTLLLDAQSEISVTGALEVSGAGSDTQLALKAGDLLWIDSTAGNLRIENASGAATGVVDVVTGRFVAASAGALGDLAGLTPSQIDARLAQNDGVVRDEGVIQAGALEVQVDSAFLVQNSAVGTRFNERRGLSVGSLSISTADSGSTIVINGVVGGQTGIAALNATEVDGAFADQSTINGCAILNPVFCVAVEAGFEDPARDLIEEEFDPGLDPESLEDDLQSQLIGMAPPEEFQDDPLIDDPVTGAGNEDLWTGEPECEPADESEGLCPVGEAVEEGEALEDVQ